MVEHQRSRCRFLYLDNAFFQQFKIKLVLVIQNESGYFLTPMFVIQALMGFFNQCFLNEKFGLIKKHGISVLTYHPIFCLSQLLLNEFSYSLF